MLVQSHERDVPDPWRCRACEEEAVIHEEERILEREEGIIEKEAKIADQEARPLAKPEEIELRMEPFKESRPKIIGHLEK